MSRVPITETILTWAETQALAAVGLSGPVPVFVRSSTVEVKVRGGALAALYNAESGGSSVAQPLSTDSGGRPRGAGDILAWVEEGAYELIIEGQSVPWEASRGDHFEGGKLKESALPISVANEIGAHGFNVKNYGAKGDGTTDDLAALKEANTAAAAAGAALYLPAGTYLISGEWTPTVSILASPGAKVKKSATFAASRAIKVATANLTFVNLEVDGNRSGGAAGEGIMWEAAGGRMEDCYVHSNKSHGVLTAGTAAELDCIRVRSNDNRTSEVSTSNSPDGFAATAESLLRTFDCEASENGTGFLFTKGVKAGCRLHGVARRNFWGARVYSQNGYCPHFVAIENNSFSLEVGSSTSNQEAGYWEFGTVIARDTGVGFTMASGQVVAQNNAGTSIELYGASHNQFGTVISRRPLGYALAITRESGTSVASSDNNIGRLIADQTGAVDKDPGIHISGNSERNSIGEAIVTGHTFAVSCGEGVAGTPKNNAIGFLRSNTCANGVWKVTAGENNQIGVIDDVDSYNASEALANALLYFKGAAVKANKVRHFKHRTAASEAPKATQKQEESATENGFPEAIASPAETLAALKTAVDKLRTAVTAEGASE